MKYLLLSTRRVFGLVHEIQKDLLAFVAVGVPLVSVIDAKIVVVPNTDHRSRVHKRTVIWVRQQLPVKDMRKTSAIRIIRVSDC